MRAVKLASYHLKRHAPKMIFYSLSVFIMSVSSALYLMNWTGMELMAFIDGTITPVTANTGMVMYSNPEIVVGGGLLTAFVWMSALWLSMREHKFIVSLSVTRIEVLMSSTCYLVALSAIMTGVLWVSSTLGRGVLWAAGFKLRDGWDVYTLLTGKNSNMMSDLLLSFTGKLLYAGSYTLTGYIFVRWWKVILIGFGALIALIITVTTQIQLPAFLTDLRPFIEWLVQWIYETVLPFFRNFFNESRLYMLALRDIGFAFVCFALCYPVMRKMAVIK
jgi:hypothetical protein